MKEMLCGIEKHVDLQCSSMKSIEKETGNGDVGAVETPEGINQSPSRLDDYQDWSWINSIGWEQPNMGEIDYAAKRSVPGERVPRTRQGSVATLSAAVQQGTRKRQPHDADDDDDDERYGKGISEVTTRGERIGERTG